MGMLRAARIVGGLSCMLLLRQAYRECKYPVLDITGKTDRRFHHQTHGVGATRRWLGYRSTPVRI